ncbi:hypothetical protein BDQ12DRAFT_694272 [Crucibulum laeve]|uniref:SET domain-containing protein n=1 Tax=Crucibulum laeve TaxID=68775 RepID=A0A5C3LFD3_9AGAR|nr:hypothetical protein BDQ12DRAFT_694272 [Crucibulum laeve]
MKRGFLKSAKAQKTFYPAEDEEPVPDLFKQLVKGTKLSYGKVKEAGRPEGYQTKGVEMKETAAECVDHPEGTKLFTTIPIQYPDSTYEDQPVGWSECFISADIKRMIYETPGFGRSPPSPNRLNYRIESTPNMGLGMFAAHPLKMGDLILSERPLLVVPRSMTMSIGAPVGFTPEQYRQALMFEWEKYLEMAVNRMFPENRKAYYALANNHSEDGSGRILGILRTNGYDVGGDFYDKKLGKHDGAYSATCDKMSRLNHSCRPNVSHSFDIASFSFQLRPVRDIQAGEQLFYSYCKCDQPAAARQKALEPYGVRCTCESCLGDATESDELRTHITPRFMAIQTAYVHWLQRPPQQRDDSVLKPALALLSAFERDGLHSNRYYSLLLDTIREVYSDLGDKESATKYARLLRACSIACTGSITR